MSSRLSVFIYSISFILLTSCKIYYKTSDVDAKLKGAVQNVNTNCNDVLSKLKTLQGSYASIMCPSDTDPFKTAGKLSSEVATGQKEIAGMQKTVNDAYGTFTQYTKGKDKIASGTEEWKKFKQTKKLVKSTMKSLQSKGEATIEKATAFNAYIIKEIVPKVQVCETKSYLTNVEKTMPDFPKVKQELTSHVKKYTLQLSMFEKKVGSTHPNEMQQLHDDLKKLKDETPLLDQAQQELTKAISDFKSATVNKDQIYSCSPDWTIVSSCNASLGKVQSDLNSLQSRIQSTVTHMQSVIDSVK